MPQTQIDEAAERVKFIAEFIRQFDFTPLASNGIDIAAAYDGYFYMWLAAKRAVLSEAKPVEPDWTGSKTLISSLWKNPLLPISERLEIADGAVAFRDAVIAKLRGQLKAAPPAAEAKDSERYRELLAAVIEKIPHHYTGSNDAPGHSHIVPGVWDADNFGRLAGKECEWCKVWHEAKRAVAAKEAGQ